jgi:hypothetical protein
MRYLVGKEPFPYGLPGLTKAIKFAQELAYEGSVDVMKEDDEGNVTLAYRVHKQEREPRKGYVDIPKEHRKKFGA